MTHKSLLDEEPNQPDDDSSTPEEQPEIMNELSTAVYQLTWRMAGFTAVLLSAGFAFARYL